MQELLPGIYTEPVPLPGSPLKWVNSYVVKGEDRSLLVDTAFNTDESEAKILAFLSSLGVTAENTDLFITHLHVDHCGLADRLKRPQNKVMASPIDSAAINDMQTPKYWDRVYRNNMLSGVPENEALDFRDHVAYRCRPARVVPFDVVKPGDQMTYGRYTFTVMDLAGHSPGQIGLWEPEAKVLFCGDHVLDRITPNIAAWDLEKDYLGLFLNNLQAIRRLDIQYLFTAHRELPPDPQRRIGELLAHHDRRLNEVLSILKSGGEMTPYQVAQKMTWSMKGSFDEFPKNAEMVCMRRGDGPSAAFIY